MTAHQQTDANVSYSSDNKSDNETDFDAMWDDTDNDTDSSNNSTDSSNNSIIDQNSDYSSNENTKSNKKISEKQLRRIKKQKEREKGKENAQQQLMEEKEKQQKIIENKQWNVSEINNAFNNVKINMKQRNINQQSIKTLQELIKQCDTYNFKQAQLTVMSLLISFYFKNPEMSHAKWKQCTHFISQLIFCLHKNINTLRMSNDCQMILILKQQHEQNNNEIALIYGNLLTYIKQLTAHLWKNLKSISLKSVQYAKILNQTSELIEIYESGLNYFGALQNKTAQCELELLFVSIIYSNYNETLDELNKKSNQSKYKIADKLTNISVHFQGESIFKLPLTLMVKKAKFIFDNGSKKHQIKAMLYLIYNMALHNKYKLCQNLLLMSYLNSLPKYGKHNIELQVLYNRTLAQYAICSFCYGDYYGAMIILQQLFSSHCINILLAQDFIRAPIENATNKQIMQEQRQKKRMLAPHFHVTYDTLNAIYLLSIIFIEIPNIKTNNIKNFYFRKIYNGYLQRDLILPPENNTQNLLLSIFMNMQNGEWIKCKRFVKRLRLWNSSDIKNVRYVYKNILSKIKRECLRCYLYKFGAIYESISVSKLSNMFDLKQHQTKQFICRLIVDGNKNEQFLCLDELSECVIIKKAQPTQIQKVALEYSNKVLYLIQQNEKLLRIKYYKTQR